MPDSPKPKVRKRPPPHGRTQAHADKRRPEPDPIMGICDRCATPAPVDELQNGPEGSEWDGCAICNDCFVEIP